MTPEPPTCSWPGCRKVATIKVSEAERYCHRDAVEAADREARLWAMEFHGRVCQWCGKDQATDVHHMIGKGAHPRLRHERANLLPLDRTCHRAVHAEPAAARVLFDARWPGRRERLFALERRPLHVGPTLADVIRGFREEGLTPAEMERYRSGAWLG